MLANFAFYHALARGMGGWLSTSAPVNKIEIYSGDMPADADDWFPGYGGSPGTGSPLVQLLATFSTFRIDDANDQIAGADVQSVIFQPSAKPTPNPVNATATGTASWYAMYDSSRVDRVLIGEVSNGAGTGTLRLDSVSLTASSPVTITHFGVRFGP